MAKAKRESVFVCTSCGAEQQKWLGRCPACRAWNSFEEATRLAGKKTTSTLAAAQKGVAMPITDISHAPTLRHVIGISELDRVLGGGLVPGSVTLVGGEPGIGKSTLLLTVASCLAKAGLRVLYVSAEESVSQIRLTAERLKALHAELHLLSETDFDSALLQIDTVSPQILIIDSIQTVYSNDVDSAPGSVSQVREITARIVQLAKQRGIATFVVGHVTKEGNIAGPRLLEHMVDTVLYFESTRSGPYRMLRVHKNRFGSTNEVGVFEMQSRGLKEVLNPSEFFLAERPEGKSGSAVTASIEGTRPILLEIQALCVATVFGTPRRTSVGVDNTRCALLAAVLEKHARLSLSGHDLFVNVAGGTSLIEPACDLPVAMAIASSLTNRPVKKGLICFGEVGLSGEMRGVHRTEDRLKEAVRLGFDKAILPKIGLKGLEAIPGIKVAGVDSILKAIELGLEECAPSEYLSR